MAGARGSLARNRRMLPHYGKDALGGASHVRELGRSGTAHPYRAAGILREDHPRLPGLGGVARRRRIDGPRNRSGTTVV
jgi:hypothetical protein